MLYEGKTMNAYNREDLDVQLPTRVTFQEDTIHKPAGNGDNWCITWAADDSQVTSMCDGNWLGSKHNYHNHLYRIIDGQSSFLREDIPNYPHYSQSSGGPGSWFGYGIISVDGNLYSVVSKTPGDRWSGPFRGVKLLKSKDNGHTWYRVDRKGNERKLNPFDEACNAVNTEEMFFLEEFGMPHVEQEAYPFSCFVIKIT